MEDFEIKDWIELNWITGMLWPSAGAVPKDATQLITRTGRSWMNICTTLLQDTLCVETVGSVENDKSTLNFSERRTLTPYVLQNHLWFWLGKDKENTLWIHYKYCSIIVYGLEFSIIVYGLEFGALYGKRNQQKTMNIIATVHYFEQENW